ncbi:ABC transporter permease [Paramaledivibacter caminithermalis]|jgi:putative spermidine/putrescine transport system permease protein|uniref:Putative spermidine/putrescine transport system permease protein n=1 Tax=Paramaledivibacter caminithermalis (strain DSM 15212 / CIP 107654 / DViRD3) TaxID=1121301 RepID=A0A1M6MY48_PARC5|nr:ABC transporter permease subunit [Paramaledivibacter caminithermalis]SHJ88369.1 putative spermidine/putrescine transport system permease protein [Paramaledivibacter caminithermalis DSM 15212]
MKRNSYISKVIMCVIIFLLIFPLGVVLLWSFVKIWPWPNLVPRDFGIRAFEYILNPNNKSIRILCFSVCLSSVVTVITLLISIPAAKALGVYNFKGKDFFKILVLAPIIVPTIAVAMGIHVAFIKLGLANTVLGVVLVHLIPCLPYGIRILTNVFEIIGESMEMQARVLGANSIQTFIRITLPLIAPGLLSAGSLVFIVSFSQYFLTFLIGGGRIITFSMLMFPYIQSGDRMMACSYSIVFILSTLVILLIIEKIVRSYYKGENYFYM